MHNGLFRKFLSLFEIMGVKNNEDILYRLCKLGGSWKQFNRVETMKE